MTYYAHTRESGQWQTVKDHLLGTAEKAKSFAIPALKESAYLVGLLHDLGKYSDDFQRRLNGADIRVDHSTYGAKEILKEIGGKRSAYAWAYVIAGHHAGLPDLGNVGENENRSTLRERLKTECSDASAWKKDIEVDYSSARKEYVGFSREAFGPDEYEFMIRYLFSCLTDADSLDTENFCSGKERVACDVDWSKYKAILDRVFASFNAVTELQKERAVLQSQAMSNIGKDCGIYLLDMPTGSGKTLCSLDLAIERAAKMGKKRIIYVIPYTTVIEQTADEFGKILSDLPILEHHSNFDFDEDVAERFGAWNVLRADGDDCKIGDIMKQRAENWDAPFVITTNVQFFESIYSNKRSKLRKLHNMADSVIVFDEMHTLPIKYFAPCMRAIEQLTTRYNSEAIFLTATMPDFVGLAKRYLSKDIKMLDLVPDKSGYRVFDKCTFEYIGQADVPSLIDGTKSTLVVCNRKRDAEDMYSKGNAAEKYCLSTYLTPVDRKMIIDEIKRSLSHGGKPVVFSTSLIEAGVDLDFECVYRELAGIDNILQTAGRCNRNGARSKEESKVYIYSGQQSKDKELYTKADTAKGIILNHGVKGLMSQECVRYYYNEVYETNKKTMKDADINFETTGATRLSAKDRYEQQQNKREKTFDIDFASIAKEFHLIDASRYAVVIPDEEIDGILAMDEIPFEAKRKLQRRSASVTFYELKSLIGEGVIECKENGLYVLTDSSRYDRRTGLKVKEEGGQPIFA